MSATRSLAFAAAGLAVACVTVVPPAGSAAPKNTCSSDLDCARYMQTGVAPTCSGGICQTTAQVTQWTAVVSLSENAAYAPGATFVVRYSDLLSTTNSPCAAACPPNQICVQLPALATTGNLDVEVPQSAALIAHWNLGNPNMPNTALPVTPILRPQVAPGIPLQPIVISETINSGADAVRGPGGGPSLQFSIAVPPAVYEQTLMPVAPFDQAFPPDVRMVDLTKPPYPEQSVHLGCDPMPPGDPLCTKFDATASSLGAATYPTFEVTRSDGGPLDGWVAFLRDDTTLRRISNQVPLQGTDAKGVQLLTSHHPASGNALENADLVLQPPAASGLPTLIVAAFDGSLPTTEPYPQLPQAVEVTGKIVSAPGGHPVPADVVFEASGKPTLPTTGLCRVPQSSNVAKFDPSGDLTFTASGAAADGSFTVTLPQGVYRATVRPRDTTSAVTIVPNFGTVSVDSSGTCLGALQPAPIAVGSRQTIRGTAFVLDGRPLAAATMEAIPTGCSQTGTGAACLPRAAQATTDGGGAYAIDLDPGVYSLRVRPAEGSALPWVVTTLSVGAASVTPGPPILVPAPVYAGLLLQDYKCNPVVEGLVRMYETPTNGSAFEIGEAVTDATGHYDMYLAPPSAQ